ncbi:MAG TPA: peptidoglycan-binding protein [Chthoniobacterales bacterium]|nr:peptidoglycan-binding protein [Chthoniobacterales bacterium]
MKSFLTVLTAVAVNLAASSAWARGNSGGSSAPATSGGHSGSSAPAAISSAGPRLSGGAMPHYARSGQMPYRPTVTYRNGTKTLNYPAVQGSTVYRSTPSNLSNVNNARAMRHSNANLQTRSANLQRSSGNFQRGSGNLRTTSANSQRLGNSRAGGNSQHAAAMNIASKKGNRIDPQTSARLRNWHGNVSSTAQAQQNHWNNCHHHHNHDWWHNHCVAFIFWDWGWWGWWDGWWYPAWGYDPYSYYGYNDPVYGYGDLSPEQIVASVQIALQQQGYYQYAIDGQMGPMTKEAIARYQRDHRLPITYGVDPATLGSLGIVH